MYVQSIAVIFCAVVLVHANVDFPTELNITCGSVEVDNEKTSLTLNDEFEKYNFTIQNLNCNETDQQHSFDCPVNTEITLELRTGNLTRNMIDKNHFRRFIVMCRRKLKPYTQTVSVQTNFSMDSLIKKENKTLLEEIKESQKYQFNMKLKNGTGPFAVGTNLILEIAHENKSSALKVHKILVLRCEATGPQATTEKYIMTDQKGCKVDTDNLFTGHWTLNGTDLHGIL